MAVKAKFYVTEITRRASGSMGGYAEPVPLGEVIMRPVTGKAGNEEWASATPSGEFKMVVRGEALNVFERLLGKDVSITIEEYGQ
jgi:hypothetical protein